MNLKEDLHKNLTHYINCKDHTVSNETYSLQLNKELNLLVTQPVPQNLEKYYESEDYISHTDSNKSIIDKVYQLVKNYSLKKKLKLINSFNTENKTILDIGAGTGEFLNVCKENNWKITGIEPSVKARNIASTKGIKLNNSIENLEIAKYDIITMWHVLEHIPNLIEYITQLKKLLKPNGVLIIAVPNYNSYDAKHYKQFWAAFDVPRHLWHFSQQSIKILFSMIDMKIENILPMKFDSYYVSLLSEKYKNGSMKPFKAFFIGLKSNIQASRTKEYSSLIYVIKNSQN